MRTFIGQVPLSVLAFLIAVVLAVVLSSAAARRLRTRRSIAALLLAGFGLVVAATLVPTAAAVEGAASDGVCDFSRVGLAPIEELIRPSFTSLNVLLFVPLGVAVGLLPRGRAAALVAVGAIALPFVVESIQLVATDLGRGCQTADIIDNLLGLIIGMVTGSIVRGVSARVAAGQDRPA